MDNDGIVISGPVKISALDYNGIKFYMFGDSHGSSTIGNCESQNFICDRSDKETNCWNIGILLEEWFKFNFDNKIRTDFYLELPFIKNADGVQLPRQSTSWISILGNKFIECLAKEKRQCIYYPYIHFHYANIRRVDDSIDINIFRTKIPIREIENFISSYLDHNNDLNELNNILYNLLYDLVTLSKMLYDNIDNIFSDIYMGKTDLVSEINKYRFLSTDRLIGRIYNDTLNNIIDKLSVKNENTDYISLHRTANEYYRLKKLYPEIAEKLALFINDNIIFFKQRYTDIWDKLISGIINDFRLIDYSNKENTLKSYINILKSKSKQIDRIFVTLGTLDVDIYTISRMFLQAEYNGTNEILVYMGSNHITNYRIFIHRYLSGTLIYSNQYIKNNRCINVPISAINPYKF